MLEPGEGKLSRRVLRGEGGRKAPALPDRQRVRIGETAQERVLQFSSEKFIDLEYTQFLHAIFLGESDPIVETITWRLERLHRDFLDHLPDYAVFREYLPRDSADNIGSTGIPMVIIPKGSYLVGRVDFSNEIGRSFAREAGFTSQEIIGHSFGDNDEFPIQKVSLERYAIGLPPITLGQYNHYSGKAPVFYESEDEKFRKKYKDVIVMDGIERNDTRLPLVCVSFHDAQAFCDRLSQTLTGGSATYRLPSEAEWESACRAGTRTAFPWGNNVEEGRFAGYFPNRRTLHPVKSFPPNRFGLYDMIGNVYEWVGDQYAPEYRLDRAAKKDLLPGKTYVPAPQNRLRRRVLRGGAWDDENASSFRSAFRAREPVEDNHLKDTGFRVVREL